MLFLKDMVNDEKLEYFCGSLKNRIFRGGHEKSNIEGENSLKMGGLGHFADLMGRLARNRGG